MTGWNGSDVFISLQSLLAHKQGFSFICKRTQRGLQLNADRAVMFNQAEKAHIKTAKKRPIKTKKAKNKTKSRCRLGSDHDFDALWYNIIRKGKQTGFPSGGPFNIEILIPGF